MLQQRLRAQFHVARIGERTELQLAPSLVYLVVADGKLGDQRLRGSSLAAMISVGVGF